MPERNLVRIDDTRFIFPTNFSGDPDRDQKFHSSARRGNIIIPDPNQAVSMRNEGFNVKMIEPKDPDDPDALPTYYIPFNINYDSKWPPKIYLVSGDAIPVPLTEETVGQVDYVYVLNVNATFSPYENPDRGTKTLYVRTMYVEQDVEDDPYASRYAHPRTLETEHPEDDESLPFC